MTDHTKPEQPPARTELEQLRDSVGTLQTIVNRVREAVGTDEPAEAEAERYKADYLKACVTIARMHAAATGRSDRGPERGVIEDVEDVRARMLAAEEALTNEQRERAEASQLSHQYRNCAERAEAERDGAYRERAQLLAWLAALHAPHAVLAPAVDIDDEDGWWLLFLTVAGRQMTWHIAPRDVELFQHVEHVDVADPRAQWDGHTTAEKYERIRTLRFGEMRAAVRTPSPAAPAPAATEATEPAPCCGKPSGACPYGTRCPNCRD